MDLKSVIIWLAKQNTFDGKRLNLNRGHLLTVTAVIAGACLQAVFNPPGGLTTTQDMGVVKNCTLGGSLKKIDLTGVCPAQSMLGVLYHDESGEFFTRNAQIFSLSMIIFTTILFGLPQMHPLPIYLMNLLILYTLSKIFELMLLAVTLMIPEEVFNVIKDNSTIHVGIWIMLEWGIGIFITVKMVCGIVVYALNWGTEEEDIPEEQH